jgi:G3E family GTPase
MFKHDRNPLKLDAIVTVVDALHLLDELDRAPEVQEQVAFADVVLVNKIDLVSSADLASIEKRIRQINPYAQTYSTERCGIDLGKVLGRDAFNLDRILEIEPAFLSENHDPNTTIRSAAFRSVSTSPSSRKYSSPGSKVSSSSLAPIFCE